LLSYGYGDGKGPVALRKPNEFGRRESCEKDFVSMQVVCFIFTMTKASGLETWAKKSVASVYWEEQRDRGPAGSLEQHWKRGSGRGPKYPRKNLV